MAAILVEDQDELDGTDVDTLAGATVTPGAATNVTDPEASLEDTVPEKYKGKTARELLDIINNQESMIGRHGQELGDLRSQNGTLRGLVDQSLELRNTGNSSRPDDEEATLQDDDFTLTPLDATQRTVHSETKVLRDKVTNLEASARNQQFVRDFPDATKDLNDPTFQKFVQGSDARKALASKAFANPKSIDYNSAQDLWERYNDYKSVQPATSQESDAEAAALAAKVVTDASVTATEASEAPELITGTSGSAGDPSASGKPKYSQLALNALQLKDSDLFWREDTQKRIEEARADGRIVQDA